MKFFTSPVSLIGKTNLKGKMSMLFALVFMSLGVNSVQSQVVWAGAASCVSGSGGTWLTATSWCGGVIPASGQIAQFGANGTATTIGFNMNGATTAQKTIGAIELASTNTLARTINNSSTTVAGSMIFTGATVNSVANTILRNNSSVLLTVANGASQNLGVTLSNATDNIVNIDGTGGITISTVVSDGGSAYKLTKTGVGTGVLTLSGTNTYTGGTVITGGTVVMGATNALSTTGTITLNGGTLKTGATTGFSETTTGTLSLTDNSTLALGTGSHTITFGASNAATWTTGKTLTITGWTGTAGAAGTAGRIFVGSSATGLTSTQLSQITFSGFSNGTTILSTGELVPAAATPTTTSISPTTATVGGNSFTITVNGTNFVSGQSTVTWAGSARTTTFVSATQLTATITGADIQNTGTYAVGVTTTGALASSNTQNFTVSAAAYTGGGNIVNGGVNFVGRINGYSQPTNCTGGDYRVLNYRRVSATSGTPTDGRGQWVTTVNVQSSGGNVAPDNMPGGSGAGFLFTSGGGCGSTGNYTDKWNFSGVGQGALDAVNSTTLNSSTDMGLNMGTAGRYTFVMKDVYNTNGPAFYVGYTTNNPVTITHTGAAQQSQTPTTATITATLNASPSSQEKFYLRYRATTNDLSTGTSQVLGTVSGTTVTFSLSSLSAATTYYYYILSTTSSTYTSLSEVDKSLSILNYADNSGSNYSFTFNGPTNYVWNVAGGGSWATATNWTPNGVPQTGDAVTFSNGSTGTITAVPTATLTSLTVSGNSNYTLNPVAASTVLTLTNTGTALSITSGSTLTIGGTATGSLTLNYSGTGNTATIAGTLILTGATNNGVYDATNSATTVSGTLQVATSATSITSTTSNLIISGTYNHAISSGGGTIPTATWQTGSNCSITGTGTSVTAPSGLGQSFSDFTWNTPNLTSSVNLGGALTTIGRDFNITSTGSLTLQGTTGTTGYSLSIGRNLTTSSGGFFTFVNGATTTNSTLTVTGVVNINGGGITLAGSGATASAGTVTATITGLVTNGSTSGTSFVVNAGTKTSVTANLNGGYTHNNTGTASIVQSSAVGTMNVVGDFTLQAGTFNMSLGSAVGTLNVSGNFSQTGGTITETSSGNGKIILNAASGTQNITATGTIANDINWQVGTGSSTNTAVLLSNLALPTAAANMLVKAGSTLNFGTFSTTGLGTFTTEATSGLISANTNAAGAFLTGATATGSVQSTGTRTYATNTDYTFNGAAAQFTGSGVTAPRNLTINNTFGVTITNPATVSGTLALTAGKVTLGANDLTASGTISGASSTNYIVTNGAGQLKRTVAGSAVAFPVGLSAYDPITLTNSGVSDTYGIVVTDAAPSTAADATKTVNHTWVVTEALAGGGSLTAAPQFNGGEAGGSYSTGATQYVGLYNGSWTQLTGTLSGTNPYIVSASPFTNSLATTGSTSYFAVGNQGALIAVPTITSVSVTTNGTTTTPNAYVGSTITINGSGFSAGGVSVKIGGSGGTTASNITVVSDAQITATMPNATASGVVYVITNGGNVTDPTATSLVNLGYITQAAGSYNTGATWLGGATPPASGATVTIAHSVSLDAFPTPTTVTIASGGNLTNSTGTMTATNLINNGTLTIAGTAAPVFTITNFTNAGTVTFQTTGTLNIAAGGTLTNNSGGTFTTTQGTVAFGGAALLNGSAGATVFNMTLNGATTFTTAPTINGTLLLNSGYSVTGAPNYGSTSTLKYNSGGVPPRGAEWSSASGAGYPANVQISNNTTLDPGGTSMTGTALNLSGNLTIDAGSSIYLDNGGHNMTVPLTIGGNLILVGNLSGSGTGGNVIIKGNWTNNGTAANYFPNGSSVTFSGTSNQTWGGTNASAPAFYNVIINNAAGVTLTASRTISNNLTLTSGLLTLGTNNLTLSSGATTSSASATSYVNTSSTGRLIQTVGNSNVFYPVGRSAYNPITLNNSGTSDTYGVYVVDATTSPVANDNTKLVNRYWNINEGAAGGSNLAITTQWNSPAEENSNFAAGTTNRIGMYTGSWTTQTATAGTGTVAGSATFTSNANFTPADITGGATVGAGKDNAFVGIAPTVTSFSPTSGYQGTTVIITGTDFSGVTSVTFGGTAAATYTVDSQTQITAKVGTGATGTVSVTTASGTGTSTGTFTFIPGYITTQSGDYNTASTWLAGAVPPAGVDVIIAHAVTINAAAANQPNSVTINSGASLDFSGASGALTTATVTNNGTLSFSAAGTLTIAAGGTLTNNATFTGGTGTVNTAGAATINGTSAITFNNLTINTGGVTFSTIPTIDGILRINGGNVNQAPYYTANSTLLYNASSYTRYLEWSANGVGTLGTTAGYPNNVTINVGSFTVVNADAGTPRAMAGNLTVNTGASFNTGALNAVLTVGGNVVTNGTGVINLVGTNQVMAVGGSVTNGGQIQLSGTTGGGMTLKGDFTNNGTFTSNTRTTQFIGTSLQTISGTMNGTGTTNNFGSLLINNSSNVTLATPVNMTNTLTLTAGKLILNGNNFTLLSGATNTGASAASYVQTNGTGQMKQVVAASAVTFPVGNSSYNPITFTNSGTSDTYGVNVVDGTIPTALDATYTVNRRWLVTEAVAGGSNLAVTGQYNTGEENTNYNSGTTDYIGLYNGTAWTEKTATRAGSNPFTVSSTANFTPSDLSTGTQYFALAKDNGLIVGAPTISSFTPTSGYTGSTVVITGTNFTGATAVSIGGVAAASFTVNSSTQITATVGQSASSGSVSVTSPSGTGTLTGFTYLGYITQSGATLWGAGTSWLGGSVPPAGATTTVAHDLTLAAAIANSPATITVNNGVTFTISASPAALTATTSITNNGTVTFSGSGTLTTALFTNNGTLSWTGTGTLAISAGGTLTNNGTFTRGTGTVAFAGAGTVNGTNNITTFTNLTIGGVVTLPVAPTIDGIYRINGGNLNVTPIYTANSTLQYATTYTRFTEWNAVGVGTIGVTPGYPNNVLISNSAVFTLLNADAGTARAMAGNLTTNTGATFNTGTINATVTVGGSVSNNGTINLGATTSPLVIAGSITTGSAGVLTLSTALGGDLYVSGNFTNNNNFTHNSRAVYFTGTAQTVTGFSSTGTINNFAYVRINNGTNVTLGGSAYVINNITFNSGKITLGAFDLTMASGATFTTPGANSYVVTNGIGQLKQVVAASAVTFPVGNATYNPVTFTNTGTSDTYGIIETDGAVPNAADATKAVNRRWLITEAVSGNSNLTPVVLQYNSTDVGTNYNAGTTPLMGFFDGAGWTTAPAVIAGSNPFTATATGSNQFPNTMYSGSYLAIGKDNAFGSAENDYYRSVTTGNWSSSSTWESSTDSVTWYSATSFPGKYANSGKATVRSGHTVTDDVFVNPAYLTILNGGTVIGSDDNAGIYVGASGAGALVVEGTLTLQNTVGVSGAIWLKAGTFSIVNGGVFNNSVNNYLNTSNVVSVSSFYVANGGTYNHDAIGTTAGGAASDFPGTTRTFGATSNVVVTKWGNGSGNGGALPNNMGNLTINIATQSAAWQMAGAITSIQGNLNIQNTGTTSFRFFAGTAGTLTIGGNVTVSGGTLHWTTTSSPTINLAGGLTISGGTYQADQSTGQSNLNFTATGTGDIDVSGGTVAFGNTTVPTLRTVNILNSSNVIVAASRAFTVSGRTNIYPAAMISGSGTFTLTSATTAFLGIGSTAGITATGTAAGSVQTSSRFYGALANYLYTGIAPQVTGTGLPSSINSLTIGNTGASGSNSVTLTASTALSSALNPSLILASGLLNVPSGKNIDIGSGGGVSGSGGDFAVTTPANSGTITFKGTGTVAGTVNFYPGVIQAPSTALGVSYGTTATIRNFLRLDLNSFISANPPSYATGSTLIYNSGGTYARNAEWAPGSGVVGVPYNVTVQGTTLLNFDANNASTGDRYMTGDLTLGVAASSGSLSMGAMTKKIVVGGNVVIGNTVGTSTLTLSSASGGDIEVNGNWTRNTNGVFAPSGRAVFFTGATPTTITTATTGNFDYLFISKNAGVATTIANNIQVNNNLNLSSILTTNAFKVIIPTQTGVTAAGGWVAGYLQKAISTAGAANFEIGGPNYYRPVNLNFNTVTTGGNLTAIVSQTAGEYAPLTGSGLVSGKVVNRYFNLTSSGLTGNYDGTFNFVGIDTPATGNSSQYVVRNTTNGGSNWNAPLTGTRTTTSTQATGITTFGDFVIGNSTTLSVTQNPRDTLGCIGSTVAFNATASAAPTLTASAITVQWQVSTDGGTTYNNISAGGSYSIANSTAGANPYSSTLTVTGLATGMNAYMYRAVFTDFSGNATSTPGTLTVEPAPTVSINGGSPQSTCAGTPLTLTATATAGGGTIASYQWKVGGGNISGANASTYSTTTAGSYTVTVVSSNGCPGTSAPVTVNINALPAKPTITADKASACDPDSIVLTSSFAGAGNVWSPGGKTTDTIHLRGPGTYTYTVTYTDGNGCTSPTSDPITRTIYNQNVVTITPGGPLEFCQGDSVDLVSSASSGNMWTTTSTTPISNPTDPYIRAKTSGVYTVTQTNANGCQGSASATVKVNPLLPVSVTISASPAGNVCSGSPITLTANPTNGGTTPAYQWSVNGVVQGSTTNTLTLSSYTSGDSVSVTLTSNATPCATGSPASAYYLIAAINTWTGGNSTDWNDAGNWSCNVVPTATTDVTIPNVVVLPTLTNASFVRNINIQSGAAVTLSTQTLTINGALTGTGTMIGSLDANLQMNGTGTLRFTGGANVLNNLTVNSTGTVTLSDTVKIAGTLTPAAGTLNLAGYNVTLLAGTSGEAVYGSRKLYPATGILGPVAGTLSYNGGTFTAERYIPSGKRAFRFLTSEVNTTTSLRANWMEGAFNPGPGYGTNNNPNPGYGTHITGSSTPGDNLDWTQLNNPSLFVHDNATETWSAIYNSNGTLAAGFPYRLLVRGNRSYDLSSNTSPASSTILRATGTPVTGTVTLTSTASTPSTMPKLNPNANGYAMIGNPYASVINWNTLAKTNVATTYYAWDPNINTRGAYVAYNGTTDITGTAGSQVNRYIQPGEAFMVQTTGGGSPSLQFNETDKANTFRAVFRNSSTWAKMNIQLFTSNNGSADRMTDAVTAVFDDQFTAGLGEEDSYKLTNLDENMGIKSNSKLLSIEGRPTPQNNDSLPLKIWTYRTNNYFLSVDATNFGANVAAVVKDAYLGTETPLNLAGVTMVPFSITADVASSNADRFTILFRPSGTLPVTVTNLKAYEKDKGVQVDWTSQSEINVARYEVEKSTDGRTFEKAATVAAKANNGATLTYGWFDANPVNGANYYRIKVADKSGDVKYTNIAKVNIGKGNGGFAIYPNPVKGNVMNVQFNNLSKGKYNFVLYNNLGEKVFTRVIEHTGGSANYSISAGQLVTKGSYRLHISNGDNEMVETLIFE